MLLNRSIAGELTGKMFNIISPSIALFRSSSIHTARVYRISFALLKKFNGMKYFFAEWLSRKYLLVFGATATVENPNKHHQHHHNSRIHVCECITLFMICFGLNIFMRIFILW